MPRAAYRSPSARLGVSGKGLGQEPQRPGVYKRSILDKHLGYSHGGCRPGLVELAPLAVRAVERVLAEESELQDLRQEAGDPAWAETARDLLGRLR
jgi:hypothetical protein